MFPSMQYAEAAKNSIEVDPPFQDTKNKKTSIQRVIDLAKVEGSDHMCRMEITFSSKEDEANSLRTCVSAFVNNLTLICETMEVFGN
jgi:hypothetical protein